MDIKLNSNFMNNTIIRITCRIETPTDKGSGVFILPKDDSSDFLYIATAKHCILGKNFDKDNKNDEVRIFVPNNENKNSFSEINLTDSDNILYPKGDIDCAIIVLKNRQGLKENLPRIDITELKDISDKCIFRGYPQAYNHIEGANIINCKAGNNIVEVITPLSNLKDDPDSKYNCQGFSGGGLFCHKDDNWYLTGIIYELKEPFQQIKYLDLNFINSLLHERGYPYVNFIPHNVIEYIKDIQAIRTYSKKIKNSLACFSKLSAQKAGGEKDVIISRKCVDILYNAVKTQSFIVVGEPGAGKSGALHLVAERFLDSGHPLAYLAVDRLPVCTLKKLSDELRLSHDFDEVLINWEEDKTGILIIDGLDAARGGSSEKVFRDLIHTVVNKISNWKVIASIRKFDLRYGKEFQRLFFGLPISSEYTDSEFHNIRHLNIPKLHQKELETVWQEIPIMSKIYKMGSATLKELLRSPFNLMLLSEIVQDHDNIEQLEGISTHIGLLDAFWSERIIRSDNNGYDREELLRKSAEKMINNNVLYVRKKEIANGHGKLLNDLLSANVLRQWKNDKNIAFSHNILFDYAVARLVLENGDAPEFIKFFQASEAQALIIAPGAMIALQALWNDSSKNRDCFWQKAIDLAADSEVAGLCRILAPRVAVEWIQCEDDCESLFDTLQNSQDKQKQSAVVFIIRHIFSALIADIIPEEKISTDLWTDLLLRLAEINICDLAYPIKNLIDKFILKLDRLSDIQKLKINKAACLILNKALNAENYDRCLVNPSIDIIVKTINSDISSSVKILERLLQPLHFEQHAHSELFWLINNPSNLYHYAPEFLMKLYGITFSSPLPSDQDKTQIFHSRILPLISNRRQDFMGNQRRLVEIFVSFVEAEPAWATAALIYAMNGYIKREYSLKSDIQTILFNDNEAIFQEDSSYIRWNYYNEERYTNQPYDLLDKYIEGMDKVASKDERENDINSVIEVIIQNNKLACIWSCLMILGKKHPDKIGKKLLPLLKEPIILDCLDTRKPAGDLIKSVHPLIKKEQKAAIEYSILKLKDKETRKILIGCLDGSEIELAEIRSELFDMKTQGSVPENPPPYSMSVKWGTHEKDWWFKEHGVDLEREPNLSLNRLLKKAEAVELPDSLQNEQIEYIIKNWQYVFDLYSCLRIDNGVSELLLNQGWHVLAKIAEKVLSVLDNPDKIKSFPYIEEMIFETVTNNCPTLEKDSESSFENCPAWGTPSPRVQGSCALMILAWAKRKPVPKIADKIITLSRDTHPAVRYQILSCVNILFNANPELMWKLCEQAFEKEKNQAVLKAFLTAFSKIMGNSPDWAEKKLLELYEKTLSDNQYLSKNYRDAVTILLSNLWIGHDKTDAGMAIKHVLSNPVQHSKEINELLHFLKESLMIGDPDNPSEKEELIRKRVIDIYQSAAENAAKIFQDLSSKNKISPSEEYQMKETFHILDTVASEIYFGSKAYEATKKNGQTLPSEKTRKRFLREMTSTLEILGKIGYPSITHHLLETLEFFVKDDPKKVFRLIMNALLCGGKNGGYQYESVGADLFIKLIQQYIADYRSVLEDKEDRQNLITALNLFVEIGWPEARLLIYDLPVILR